MKFLQQDGDSVVSLRFVYQEVPSGAYEQAETSEETLTFDTVSEIQDALADLFESGEAPFDLQEMILDLDAIRAEGNYTQADMINQLSVFQNNLNATLSANGEYPDTADFMEALQEFMSSRALDLSEFVEEEASLKADIEGGLAAAESVGDRMALLESMRVATAEDPNRATEIGLIKEPERPTGGEIARATVIARADQLPDRVEEIVPNVEAAIASTLGGSTLAGFNPDQFA